MTYKENWLNWLSETGMIIISLILFSMNINLIISVVKLLKQTQTIKKWIVLWSVTTNVSFTITSTLLCICTTVVLVTNVGDYDSNSIHIIIGKMGLLCYPLSQILMVLVFTMRIDYTFRATAIAYSQCVIKSLYAASITLVIIYMFLIYCSLMQYETIGILTTILWIPLYVILSIILCVLFGKKVDTLMINRVKTNEFSKTGSSANISTTNESENAAVKSIIDNQLLYVTVKHGLLVPIGIASSLGV
eukprot:356978_1